MFTENGGFSYSRATPRSRLPKRNLQTGNIARSGEWKCLSFRETGIVLVTSGSSAVSQCQYRHYYASEHDGNFHAYTLVHCICRFIQSSSASLLSKLYLHRVSVSRPCLARVGTSCILYGICGSHYAYSPRVVFVLHILVCWDRRALSEIS